jgi:ATP-binding cassette subfamily B protein
VNQLARMRALAGYRPALYAVVFVLWTAIHLAPLVPGLVVKEFFDTLTGDARLGLDVWGLVALLVAFALGQAVILYGGFHSDALLRFSMRMLLRHNVLEKLLDRPGAQPLPRPVGEILSNLRDDVTQVEDAVDWAIDVAGTALFAAAAVGILLFVDARVTLLVFGPMIGVVALVRLASARLGHYRDLGRAATARVASSIGEMFECVETIQLAGAEPHVLRRFADLSEERHTAMVRDAVFSQSLRAAFSQTATIGAGLVLLLAASSMREGRFGVGDFALFVYYLGFVSDFTRFFGNFLAHYRQTGVSFERLDATMEDAGPARLTAAAPLHIAGPLPGAAPPRAAASFERFELRGLGFLHPGTREGVRGVDLRVDRGSLVVVTGRIASGKTTLLRAALGLLPADSGEVLWNGEPVRDPARFLVPPRCAYTPQVPRLRSGSLRENILEGHAASEPSLERALWLSALERDLALFPKGLETVVGARGLRLSGGQVHRVALARMFVREPALHVFDDLSSALDVETEAAILARIREHGGLSCLAVSHRRPVLARADSILVLRAGRPDATGSAGELLDRSEEFRALWTSSE